MPNRVTIVVLVAVAGCMRGEPRQAAGTPGAPGTIVVYNAGSLARPLRAALDSFAKVEGVTVQQESAGSLETARKLTELHKIPDLIALADEDVFPQLLMPAQTTWYADFARNRMVLAYTPRSKFATEITGENWWQVVQRPGVEVGRADPNLDPNGYRTLLVWDLAERHYQKPGLARSLLAASPARDLRPKEADLVGLLQAGELDYIWSYESLAQSAGLSFVRLPDEIDLGTPADSALYAAASVRVRGKSTADSVTFRGRAIVYALSVPNEAPHPALAARLVRWLIGGPGLAIMRSQRLDVLDAPLIVGSGVPAAVAGAGAR